VPSLVQQGIYGSANVHYFYPASCPDNNGNMIMVFSRASKSEFASIYFTGRRSTDPLGTLQSSALLKAGVANYVNQDDSGRNRWGDYAGISADPSNPKGIWFYSMFAVAANTWGTWVGSAFF
jgi:outer membrane translocation and assembly module TamA